MKNKTIAFIKDSFLIVLGAFLVAFATKYFFVPNQLMQGGFTGISLILHYKFNIPIGYLYFLLNIPLLILGWVNLGKKFILKTIATTLLLTFFIEILNFNVLPMDDRLLAAVYGGVTVGVGVGIIFVAGSSSGGTDIIAKILFKFTGLEIGTALLMIDAVILSAVMLLFGSQTFMYTLVSAFISFNVVDKIIGGVSSRKAVMIISAKHKEIRDVIIARKKRGVTVFYAEGGYTRHNIEVLYCVMGKYEIVPIKNLIKEIDQNAFMTITTVHEVFGLGFQNF